MSLVTLYTWLMNNYAPMLQSLTLMVAAGTIAVRLTPTKSDDGFLARISSVLDRVLDLLRVPNVRKKIELEDPMSGDGQAD
jgi:hypothetical protein